MPGTKIAWATDVHLDHVASPERVALGRRLAAAQAEAVVLTGDISVAACFAEHVSQLRREVEGPVYFVLGNHDFYGGRVDEVRAMVRHRFDEGDTLYLHGRIAWVGELAVVGVDGWGDARLGDVAGTDLELTDFDLIHDLEGRSPDERKAILRALGDESAEALRAPLIQAVGRTTRVLVLTHVPPFAEAVSSDYPDEGPSARARWLPYFACEAVGKVLLEVADANPQCRIEVLCGHTHHRGEVRLRPNLRVRSGRAEYGRPEVQEVLTV